MKAVSVLLCIALFHGISANIFKQQGRPVDELQVQQLEYIDQYQRQHRNQPSGNQKQHNQQRDLQVEQELNQQSEQQRQEQRQEQRQQQREQQQYERQQREQQLQGQQWDQPQKPKSWKQSVKNSQPQQYQQQQQQARRHVYYQTTSQQSSAQQSSAQQSQEQQSQEQGHSYQHQMTQQHTDSSFNKGSQESQERKQYYSNEQSTSGANDQQWQPTLQVMSQKNQMDTENENVISWKASKMASPNASAQDKDDIEKIFGDAQKAMKHISEEEKVKFHLAYALAKQQNSEDAELNATQLAQKHNYAVEEHAITTDDGYVLTLFRIPPKKHIRDVQKKPVVFLMHGILGSADDWLLMGPGKSLAYLLSDAGYDVWLGNARGNKYSKRHVSKHPAVSDFWQYSTDEIALHDLPAMIDFALETTKQEKLYYIGHAQGTTAFFALTATRPEYNDKIIMMYALSPMVYMTNVRSPLFRMIAPTSKYQARLQQQFGNGAFTPNKELIQTIGGDMLENEIGCKKVSSHVNFVIAGVNVNDWEAALIPVVMHHLPAGTSTKVIKQYGQGVASKEFQRYDYGVKMNQKVYGQEQPPKYDMTKVQAPVTLYYSEEDWLAHPTDVERLEKELPNVREANKVFDQHFSHMDFQFSTKAPEMVYRQLIESMQNNQ